MKIIVVGLLSIFLSTSLASYASSENVFSEKVASHGETIVKASFGNTNISIIIKTHEIDIGKPSDGRPDKFTSNCTYSRYPCSTVDNLEISVNGASLFVARSVYADLADLIGVTLRQNHRGQFVLTLGGGDASESYSVEVTFDGKLVKQRAVISNEGRQVMQKTTYFESEPMN
jgi:hypothetical protein